ISLLSPNTNVLNRPLGISLVFGGAIAYASYTVTLRRFVAAARADNAVSAPSSLAILTWISLFGWLFLIPLSLLEAPWTYSWSPLSWLGILYLALLSTVVGYFFYVVGVSKIGAGRAAIFGNLVPVFGVITSVLLLNENLSPWHGVSFIPFNAEIFNEYFHERCSFLLYSERDVDALYSFRSGREKWTPRADFVIVTDSLAGLKEAVGRVEDMAVAQEKLVLRTRIFGYDRKRLQALRALDYKIGASVPGAVSLDGKRFDLHYIRSEEHTSELQ